MNPDTHIIAYHGWGFSAGFWDPLRFILDDGIRFETAERGYFSAPSRPQFDEEQSIRKIVLAHSYGLHWCDRDVLSQTDHLVIMGGFLNFHPEEVNEHRRSKLVLRQMLSQFVKAPKTVLKQFYNNTFFPQKPSFKLPSNLNHDLLLADLSDLDRDEQSHQKVHNLDSITILHGSEDLIVHKHSAREMYRALRYRSQYFEILNAGHAFPVTHAEKCLEILNPILA